MMEGTECDICEEIMDEDKLIPRSLRCGHTACTICIKKLIKNSKLECPTCRKSYHVNGYYDLPVNFGVIKIIRANKNVIDKNSCSIHKSPITNRCISCKLWLCKDCIDLHSDESGCGIYPLQTAMADIKYEPLKSTQFKIDSFKDELEVMMSRINDIGVRKIKLLEEMNGLAEEENKLTQLHSDGSRYLNAACESLNSLKNVNSPQDVSDIVQVCVQQGRILELWINKNKKYLEFRTNPSTKWFQMLSDGKEVYTTIDIKGSKYVAKLTLENQKVKLFSFCFDSIPTSATAIEFNYIRKSLMDSNLVTFLEISDVTNEIKFELHIKLHVKNMPNMAKCFLDFCTGEEGINLKGLRFRNWGENFLHSNHIYFPNAFLEMEMPQDYMPRDYFGNYYARNGSVIGTLTYRGIISSLGFVHNAGKDRYITGEHWNLFGDIIQGFQTLKSLINTVPIKNIRISNCGVIFSRN